VRHRHYAQDAPAEHGTVAVGVMCAIKRALDPLCILNPGKMFG
jgi:FAD/FMN-containing dehydrogenase